MTSDLRRRHIAAIHAAATKLGMDTADKSPASDYRTMLQAVGGATSTTAMNAEALARVMKHLMRTLNPNGGKPRPKDGWQAEKIRKLWAELAKLGVLNDPSEQGLARFVASQCKVETLRFLNTHQANRIVEALKAWVERARAKA
ncbi:MAG: regulatory protein GemA [Roseateles sp.]|nr:MAG: regulatory protein GemA [Roseateles sp.]